MPEPKPTDRRVWVAAWAVLCVAGLAATSALNATSSTPEPSGDKPLSSDCDQRITDLEKWVAERKRERDAEGKESGIVTLSAVHVDDEDVCHDAIAEHFAAER